MIYKSKWAVRDDDERLINTRILVLNYYYHYYYWRVDGGLLFTTAKLIIVFVIIITMSPGILFVQYAVACDWLELGPAVSHAVGMIASDVQCKTVF